MIQIATTTHVHSRHTAIERALLNGSLPEAELLIGAALATSTLAERPGLIRLRDTLDEALEMRKRARATERGVA